MQFPYQIQLLFVFWALYYYGNCSLSARVESTERRPECIFCYLPSILLHFLFNTILLYANNTLFQIPHNLIHRKKIKEIKDQSSLVGTWVDRENSTREYLGGTWLHHFLLLPAWHYIAEKKLGVVVVLLISSEYMWLSSKRPLRTMVLTVYVLCNAGSKPTFQKQFRDVFWHFFPFLFKMYWSVRTAGTQILSGNNAVSELAFCPSKVTGVSHQLGDGGNSCMLGKRCKAGVQKFLFSLNGLLLSSFSFVVSSLVGSGLSRQESRLSWKSKDNTVGKSSSLLIGRLREEFT